MKIHCKVATGSTAEKRLCRGRVQLQRSFIVLCWRELLCWRRSLCPQNKVIVPGRSHCDFPFLRTIVHCSSPPGALAHQGPLPRCWTKVWKQIAWLGNSLSLFYFTSYYFSEGKFFCSLLSFTIWKPESSKKITLHFVSFKKIRSPCVVPLCPYLWHLLIIWNIFEKAKTPTSMLNIPYKISPQGRYPRVYCSVNSETVFVTCRRQNCNQRWCFMKPSVFISILP